MSFDGSVWAIAQGTNSAARLDPRTGTWIEHAVGLTPYTYSDFIGFGLNTFAQPRGNYAFTSEGCGADSTTHLIGARPRVEVPAGTAVEINARTANDPAMLGAQPWVRPFPVSDVDSSVDFTLPPGPLPDGRYIEVDIPPAHRRSSRGAAGLLGGPRALVQPHRGVISPRCARGSTC